MTLATRGLCFSYDTVSPMLVNVSAEFPSGTMSAVTGRSGRGKSTFLYLLGLLLQPTAGSVEVDGRPVSLLTDRERARYRAENFGFVFQDAALDSTRTVLANIVETSLYRRAARAPDRQRALKLMEQFGVEARWNAKPGQVSGGQAQRIALCRALLGSPRVLLADEPTGNLDAESGRVVTDALRSEAERGCSVVVATHDPHVVDLCDSIVSL